MVMRRRVEPNVTGIHIGAQSDSIAELGQIYKDILDADVDQNVKSTAFETLAKVFQVQNVAVSGCSIHQDPRD